MSTGLLSYYLETWHILSTKDSQRLKEKVFSIVYICIQLLTQNQQSLSLYIVYLYVLIRRSIYLHVNKKRVTTVLRIATSYWLLVMIIRNTL